MMRNHVVIDQARSDVCERAICRWDANLAITQVELPFGVCNSDVVFLTEIAPVPSHELVNREFAEGEKFIDQFGGNDSGRVRCAALKPTNVVQLSDAHETVAGILVSSEVFEVRHAVNEEASP